MPRSLRTLNTMLKSHMTHARVRSGVVAGLTGLIACLWLFGSVQLVDPAFGNASSNELLCGEGGEGKTGKPRLLVERFLLFGDFDPLLKETLEPGFVSVLALNLASPGNILVHVSGMAGERAKSPEKPYSEAAGAFADGMPNKQQTEALLAALRRSNCDYLYGGRIVKSENVISLTPYLVDVKRGIVTRMPSASPEEPALIPYLAEAASKQFMLYLRESRGESVTPSTISIGCVSAPGRLFKASGFPVGAAVQRATLDRLNFEKKLQIKRGDCLHPSGTEDAAVFVSGTIKTVGAGVELQPSIQFRKESGVERTIWLGKLVGQSGFSLALATAYARSVALFLRNATDESGQFPEVANLDRFTERAKLLELDAIDAPHRNLAVFVAFDRLAQEPRGVDALYLLSSLLYSNGEYEAALVYGEKAHERAADLPLPIQAVLADKLAIINTEAGLISKAQALFMEEMTLNERLGKGEQNIAVMEELYKALYSHGREGAAERLHNAMTDFDHDKKSRMTRAELADCVLNKGGWCPPSVTVAAAR